MHVTHRKLGETFMVSTSILLGVLLLAFLALGGLNIGIWVLLGMIPLILLLAVVRWLEGLGVQNRDVWHVAKWTALALGVSTLVVILLHFTVTLDTFTPELAAMLATLVASATLMGALAGVSTSLYRSTRQLTLRNQVFSRVLRHDLRNNLNVVLAQLESVSDEVEEPQRERLEHAEEKIFELVEGIDKIRHVNEFGDDSRGPDMRIDFGALVAARLEEITATESDLALSADLADSAEVYVHNTFGLVIDYIVASATNYTTEEPDLHFDLSIEDGSVVLTVHDRAGTIPQPDLAAVTKGAENPLEHAYGIELWLSYWLAERNDAVIEVDTSPNRIRIALPHASGLFGGDQPSPQA